MYRRPIADDERRCAHRKMYAYTCTRPYVFFLVIVRIVTRIVRIVTRIVTRIATVIDRLVTKITVEIASIYLQRLLELLILYYIVPPRGFLRVWVDPAAVPHEVLQENILLPPVPLAGHLVGLLLQQLLLFGDLRGGLASNLPR